VTHVIYGDTIRAGIEGRAEVRGLFSSLLPPANARRHREERAGLVPDALLRRPTELDAVYKDHLHDVKIIHMAPSTYSDAMVKEKGVARSANARANKANAEWAVPHQGAQTRHGMLLVGTRRGGQARPPETQIVLKSARSMRRRLRGVQLSHPSAATRGGRQVRSHTLLAPSWGRFCGGGGRDLLG
jgi:hypothetical protein